MAYEHLTPRERIHIERAHSQALYYAQRGFADAMKIYAPHVAADVRSQLTGILGTFLHAYVIAELGTVIAQARAREGVPGALPDGTTVLAEFEPMARPTAPQVFDPTKG